MYGLVRPFLFGLDPERAHALGLASLEAAYRSGLTGLLASRPQPLPTKALGLVFDNPVGLAAGLDTATRRSAAGCCRFLPGDHH